MSCRFVHKLITTKAIPKTLKTYFCIGYLCHIYNCIKRIVLAQLIRNVLIYYTHVILCNAMLIVLKLSNSSA